jgi:hypothetical protein
MNHDPGRVIELRDYISAYKTTLSYAVFKLRSAELSAQDSLDLAVYCLGDIDTSVCFT